MTGQRDSSVVRSATFVSGSFAAATSLSDRVSATLGESATKLLDDVRVYFFDQAKQALHDAKPAEVVPRATALAETSLQTWRSSWGLTSHLLSSAGIESAEFLDALRQMLRSVGESPEAVASDLTEHERWLVRGIAFLVANVFNEIDSDTFLQDIAQIEGTEELHTALGLMQGGMALVTEASARSDEVLERVLLELWRTLSEGGTWDDVATAILEAAVAEAADDKNGQLVDSATFLAMHASDFPKLRLSRASVRRVIPWLGSLGTLIAKAIDDARSVGLEVEQLTIRPRIGFEQSDELTGVFLDIKVDADPRDRARLLDKLLEDEQPPLEFDATVAVR